MRTRRPRRPKQLELPRHAGWGGRRKGAGRKPTGAEPGASHRPRPVLAARFPVHVTVRVRPEVWNLRSRRSFRVIRRALATGGDRFGLRVCAFSVQGDHLHLVCEAKDRAALSRGMKGLNVRVARGLNALMQRKGRVLADRFHAHILRTPTETRAALHYVRTNHQKHARQWGEVLPPDYKDPYCSSTPGHGVPLPSPRTWLLQRAAPPAEVAR